MGLTFKENCPDIRNTRVVDILRELKSFEAEVDVTDPWVAPEDARREHGIELVEQPEDGAYDAVILAVAHARFLERGAEGIRRLCKPRGVVFDVKYLLPADASDGRL